MKHYKAILFDFNGTLIDIWTDENREEIYRTTANLLATYGVPLSCDEFRNIFYELMKKQRKESGYEHPEFDVVGIFRTILEDYGTDHTRTLPEETRKLLPEFLSHTYRAASMLRLTLYPGVHHVLKELEKEYTLAAVSDAQSIWEEAEIRRLGLTDFFPVRMISSDFGFRKPSPELFMAALEKLELKPEEVIYVGNDMLRDVYGSKKLGMKNVFFQSNQGDHQYHGYDSDYIIYRFEELPTAIRFLEEHA